MSNRFELSKRSEARLEPRAKELLEQNRWVYDALAVGFGGGFVEGRRSDVETTESYRSREHGVISWAELKDHGLVSDPNVQISELPAANGLVWLTSKIAAMAAMLNTSAKGSNR